MKPGPAHATLLLPLLLASACLQRNADYACVTHDECASQLNRVCRGVAVEPVPDTGECAGAENFFPVLDHDRCYYAYCTPQRTVACGEGACPSGQTCVVAKTVDRSDTRLMCLDMTADAVDSAENCETVDWIETGVCPGLDQVCVLSFERRALNGSSEEPRICVPHAALQPLQ